MAHSCPDCGQACYCGGDIDDTLDVDPAAEQACTHCSRVGLESDEDDHYYYDPDPYGEG
jgi:hypothetical protein